MRGSKRETRPGVWELRVHVGRDPVTGRRRDVSRTFRGGKRDAERALAKLVGEHEHTGGSDVTVGRLFDDWLRLVDRDRSPKTADGYRRIVEQRLRPTFGKTPLRRLRADQLDRYYASLHEHGLAPRTVRNVHACLRAALAQAVRWGWIDRNVAERATPPTVGATPRRRLDTRDVLAAMTEAATVDPEFGVMIAVLAATGARRGEVCALRWHDIDLDTDGGYRLTIARSIALLSPGPRLIEKDTKTHQERTVALDDGTVEVLRRHLAAMAQRAALFEVTLDRDAFVFTDDPAGRTPLSPDRLSHAWQRACKRAGVVGLRLHDLRHWHATTLLASGLELAAVSERLGHGQTSTTLDFYSHALPQADTRAAETIGRALSTPAPRSRSVGTSTPATTSVRGTPGTSSSRSG